MVHVYEAQVELPVPAERAWAVLVDFGSYPQWNRFTSRIDAELALGRWVRMRVHLGSLTLIQWERICELEPLRVAWELPGPSWLLYAKRVQTVHATPAGCVYRTTDTIQGILAPVVEAMFGNALRNGFQAVADGLEETLRDQERRDSAPEAR